VSFALRTPRAVRALIVRETGMWLTLSGVGRHLRARGVTPQRPVRRATGRREAVRAWPESARPAIACRARAQGCDIRRADETGLSGRADYGRSSPRRADPGDRPRRVSQSTMSSLTNPGKLRFMIDEGALDTTIFLKFRRRLVREAARKLFVTVDTLPVHRAHRVAARVRDHADRIELFSLPSCAPEHNPDEFLDNDLKQTRARRRTPREGCAQIRSDFLQAHPATLSRSQTHLLPGSCRPICCFRQ
jgi:hypothetical protein